MLYFQFPSRILSLLRGQTLRFLIPPPKPHKGVREVAGMLLHSDHVMRSHNTIGTIAVAVEAAVACLGRLVVSVPALSEASANKKKEEGEGP